MDYRQEADRVSYDIITNKQLEALGSTEAFTIETGVSLRNLKYKYEN